MINIRLPILLTALGAALVLLPAAGALAVSADGSECPDSQGADGWTCNGITLTYEEPQTVYEPCTQDSEERCRVYTWNAVKDGEAPSHLNLIIVKDIAQYNIVEAYYYTSADPPVKTDLIDTPYCTGSVDDSIVNDDFPYAIGLQLYCMVKIDLEDDATKVFMKVKGESGPVKIDSMVKEGSEPPTTYGWGVTLGPGPAPPECKSDYPLTSRANIDDVAGVRVLITRGPDGCGTKFEYCTDFDPSEPTDCNQWIAPNPVTVDDNIIHCTDDRSLTTSLCNECSFTTGTGPTTMLWYKIAGEWYQIPGYPNQ